MKATYIEFYSRTSMENFKPSAFREKIANRSQIICISDVHVTIDLPDAEKQPAHGEKNKHEGDA